MNLAYIHASNARIALNDFKKPTCNLPFARWVILGRFCHLWTFFKIKFFQKPFQEHYQSIKLTVSRSEQTQIHD